MEQTRRAQWFAVREADLLSRRERTRQHDHRSLNSQGRPDPRAIVLSVRFCLRALFDSAFSQPILS
jgi:hypothetical protein